MILHVKNVGSRSLSGLVAAPHRQCSKGFTGGSCENYGCQRNEGQFGARTTYITCHNNLNAPEWSVSALLFLSGRAHDRAEALKKETVDHADLVND
jgi:hypothetical protein